MSVTAHCEMLSTQFLLSAMEENRPAHQTAECPPPGARRVKATLRTKFYNKLVDLVPAVDQSSPGVEAIEGGLKTIHSHYARKAASFRPALWLQEEPDPPNICKREELLPRSTRCTLAQLRSGYSMFLRSYTHRIGKEGGEECPDCGGTPHDTPHLFNCPAKPTGLTIRDLWADPVAVADFLGLEGPPDRPEPWPPPTPAEDGERPEDQTDHDSQ